MNIKPNTQREEIIREIQEKMSRSLYLSALAESSLVNLDENDEDFEVDKQKLGELKDHHYQDFEDAYDILKAIIQHIDKEAKQKFWYGSRKLKDWDKAHKAFYSEAINT